MEFKRNSKILSGVVAGMVVVFLLAQPFVLGGIVQFRDYLYQVLPESVSSFLWSQTLTAFTFLWAMIFLGFAVWTIRGDFFAREFPEEDKVEDEPFGTRGDERDEF